MDENLLKVKDTIIELIINISLRIDDITYSYKTNGIFANDRIVNLFDDLQSLAEGADVIREYHSFIDLGDLKEKLEMIETAYRDSDNLLLSDILSIEIKDLLEYWKENLLK